MQCRNWKMNRREDVLASLTHELNSNGSAHDNSGNGAVISATQQSQADHEPSHEEDRHSRDRGGGRRKGESSFIYIN